MIMQSPFAQHYMPVQGE